MAEKVLLVRESVIRRRCGRDHGTGCRLGTMSKMRLSVDVITIVVIVDVASLDRSISNFRHDVVRGADEQIFANRRRVEVLLLKGGLRCGGI